MTPGQLVVVLLAVAAGGLVKAVTGLGLPILAVPVMSLFVGVEDAVVIMAIPSVTSNALLCFGARGHRGQARDLGLLGVTGVLGAVAGTLVLVSVPERLLLLVLAAAILAFVVTFVRRPELRIDPVTSRRWSPVVGGVAGLLHGATGISGPIYATWLHGYRLARDAYIFGVTLLFLLAGATQLTVLLADGEVTGARALGSAAALVPTLAMIPIGTRLRGRLAGTAFDRAVLVVLAGSAVALIAQAMGGG